MSSNLTNLVLAGAFSISFTTFTAFMILPFLAAAVFTYPVFLVLFRGREHIPRSIDIQEESAPTSALTDKWGAIFGSALLTVTLGVLVGTSILRVAVWQITVPPAVIMFIRDVVYDWRKSRQTTPQPQSIEMDQVTVTSQVGTTTGVPPPQLVQDAHGFWAHLTPSYISSRFPTATTVLKRLPVALVPFALMTFVLVQGLTRKGWVELFAKGWAWWASHTGVVGVTAGMGIITCILCNVSHPSLLFTSPPDRCVRYAERTSGPRSSPLEFSKFGLPGWATLSTPSNVMPRSTPLRSVPTMARSRLRYAPRWLDYSGGTY